MARKSINELLALVASEFPDNNTGVITPAKLRSFLNEFLATMSPAYGYLVITAPSTQVFNIAASKMSFTGQYDSDPLQTTSSSANDTISRLERGTSVIEFNTDFICANNAALKFTLYKNGAPMPWSVTGVGRGAANAVSVSMTAIDYADPAATYEVWVAAETNATSVELNNTAFLLSVEPVKSYT